MTTDGRRCETCRHTTFKYTKHNPPRLIKETSFCEAPIRLDLSGVPACVYLPGGILSWLDRSRRFVWPDQGADCPIWERRSAK